jgi:hypothetical protein
MRQDADVPSPPQWHAIVLFYFLARAFPWPFFWWRDVHTQSWNASPIPREILDLTWGPAVAAYLVAYIYPRSKSRTVSLFGTSAVRSLFCFVIPILLSSWWLSNRSWSLTHSHRDRILLIHAQFPGGDCG